MPATFRSMIAVCCVALAGCGPVDPPRSDSGDAAPAIDSGPGFDSGPGTDSGPRTDTGPATDGGPPGDTGGTDPNSGPPAGNPTGMCAVPAEAAVMSVATPRTVVGTGTAASCTSEAFVTAVARGGVITFDCGPAPVTITLTQTAKIVNNTGPEIVIDGGGRVTLSGGNRRRILYQNTCDPAQMWTTAMCQNQDHPRLTVQNLTFIDGNATGETMDGGGGGAIFVRGGRFKIINSRFFHNVCDASGSDVGGGAVRVLSQHGNQPVYVVNSTFGGAPGLGNSGANGGGLSSIGVSYTVINSLFTDNSATGHGASAGMGGNGGAIYNDGNTYTLTVCGSFIHDNRCNEGGSAIFYVSNDRSGNLVIRDSTLMNNPRGTFETAGFPGIFYLGSGPIQVTNSMILR